MSKAWFPKQKGLQSKDSPSLPIAPTMSWVTEKRRVHASTEEDIGNPPLFFHCHLLRALEGHSKARPTMQSSFNKAEKENGVR